MSVLIRLGFEPTHFFSSQITRMQFLADGVNQILSFVLPHFFVSFLSWCGVSSILTEAVVLIVVSDA